MTALATPGGRARAMEAATYCCRDGAMIHPVIGCADTRYLLELVDVLLEKIDAANELVALLANPRSDWGDVSSARDAYAKLPALLAKSDPSRTEGA